MYVFNRKVIKEFENACNGNFYHVYYGNQYLDTRWYGGLRQKHFLQANDNGRNILTKDDNDQYGSYALSKLPNDKDDNWGNSRWGATSCHHVVQESWSFFQNTYTRNGFNNSNKEIRVIGNDAVCSGANANAFFEPANSKFDYMGFGSTSQGNLLATYDIGGHEFTHGISHHTANFNRFGHAASLNESFSDIFGLMTERFAKGGSFNWTMGEDANFTIRDMQNPNSLGHPAWFEQPGFWSLGSAPHPNAGAQNRYFYLLSMGGTQLGKLVHGVGVDIAANVTYYSLTNLTGSAKTYPLAREHAVAAARILYSRCSYVENQVCRAWSACNIGPYCDPCEIAYPCWTYGCGNSQMPMMGIEDLNTRTSNIELYPNPATDVLNFKFNELTNFELENGIFNIVIVDMLGRAQISKTLSSDDFKNGLSISHLTS